MHGNPNYVVSSAPNELVTSTIFHLQSNVRKSQDRLYFGKIFLIIHVNYIIYVWECVIMFKKR